MGILGVTNDERGLSMQRLPVTTKVSIGTPPNANKKYPSRLDHFQFLEKAMVDGEGVWVPDAAVTAAMVAEYGEKPTQIGIILLDDDPEKVFKTSLAWWKATEWHCRGSLVQIEDGRFAMQAERRTQKHLEGEPWPGNYKYADGTLKGQSCAPCGEGCPDLEEGKCKPSGDLYFILEKFPRLGGVCRIHTTSWRSIRNISNGLQQIRSLLGGRLAGIRCALRVAPEKIVYEGDGGKKSSTGYILSIDLSAEDLPKLIGKATEFARLVADTKKMLGGTVIVEEEDNAAEIAAEFYPALPALSEAPAEEIKQPVRASAPATTAAPTQAAKPAAAKPASAAKTNGANGNGSPKISDEQRKVLMRAATEQGWSNEEVNKLANTLGFASLRDVTVAAFDNFYQRVTNPSAFLDEKQPANA
jgi:hypothetical protein